jgi:hypothetical protein
MAFRQGEGQGVKACAQSSSVTEALKAGKKTDLESGFLQPL